MHHRKATRDLAAIWIDRHRSSKRRYRRNAVREMAGKLVGKHRANRVTGRINTRAVDGIGAGELIDDCFNKLDIMAGVGRRIQLPLTLVAGKMMR